MKIRSSALVVIAALAFALGASAASRRGAPLDSPAQFANTPTIKAKTPKQQYDRFRGEVVNFTDVTITVREPKNVYNTRTFQFTPALAKRLLNHYVENSSRVTVKYVHMSDTAVELHGKILKRK